MIRANTPNRPRPRYPLDEDDLMNQALDAEFNGGPPPRSGTTTDGGEADEIINIDGGAHWGNSSPGQPGGAYGLPGPGGGLGDSLRTVQTGPNSTMPVTDPSAPRGPSSSPGSASGAAGPAGTGRRGWAGTSGTGLNLDAPTSRGDYGTLEGFNMDRAMAGGDENSVKDAFARWVTGLGFNPARASKDEIEQILRANIDSAAQYGINILDVNGENILVETAERGPEWVDVVRGAGAGPNDPDAAWQWGAAGGGPTGGGSGGGTTGGTPYGDDMGGGGIGGAGDAEELINSAGGLDPAQLSQMDPSRLQELLEQIRRLMNPSQQDRLLGGALEEELK